MRDNCTIHMRLLPDVSRNRSENDARFISVHYISLFIDIEEMNTETRLDHT